MPFWLWVVIGLVGSLIVLILLAYFFIFLVNRFISHPKERRKKYVRQNGKMVVGYILRPIPDELYAEQKQAREYVAVIFTPSVVSSDNQLEVLKGVDEKIDSFAADHRIPEERKLESIFRTKQIFQGVVRLPDRVTDGREIYFATIHFERTFLHAGRLIQPFIILQAVLDQEPKDALMADETMRSYEGSEE